MDWGIMLEEARAEWGFPTCLAQSPFTNGLKAPYPPPQGLSRHTPHTTPSTLPCSVHS